MTLAIVTPALTVDLDDPAVLALARHGYEQAAPLPISRVTFTPVEEAPRFSWVADAEARAAHLADLQAAAEAVNRAQNPNDVVYYDHARQPYLHVRAPGEGADRYALLDRLAVDKLDPRLYGRGPVAGLRVGWRREGLWRLAPPGAAATALLSGQTLQTHDDGAGAHYVEVAGGLKGDAPAPLDILLASTSSTLDRTLIVSVLPEPALGFPTGKLFYFAAGATVTAGSLIAQTGTDALPGGQMWSWTSAVDGASGAIEWTIPSELDLAGRYRVYALSRADRNALSYQFYHGQFGSVVSGPAVTAPDWSDDNWRVTYLGIVSIPARGYNPRIAPNAYDFGITATKTDGTSTRLHLAGLFFVPVSGLVFSADLTGLAIRCAVDADQRRAWLTDAVGSPANRIVPVEGEFPHLVNPRQAHRIYVYNFSATRFRDRSLTLDLGYWPRTFGLARAAWG